jgi:transposase-like protein
MEMYVKGVSTRKVAAITEKLCGKSFSSQLVSKLAKDLDAGVESWRTRPLEGERPYLLVDARYEKVRINGRVISQGILVVRAGGRSSRWKSPTQRTPPPGRSCSSPSRDEDSPA